MHHICSEFCICRSDPQSVGSVFRLPGASAAAQGASSACLSSCGGFFCLSGASSVCQQGRLLSVSLSGAS